MKNSKTTVQIKYQTCSGGVVVSRLEDGKLFIIPDLSGEIGNILDIPEDWLEPYPYGY